MDDAGRYIATVTSLRDRNSAYLPFGHEGVLVQAIKVEEATGLLAARYAPERYREFGDAGK
jgi:hypothetical protein